MQRPIQCVGHNSTGLKPSKNGKELVVCKPSVNGMDFSKFNILTLIHYIMVSERYIKVCTFPWTSANIYDDICSVQW